MIVWLLALVWTAAGSDLEAREVRTTSGQRLLCWAPPPLPADLDAPVDERLFVDGVPTWAAQRCRRVGADEAGEIRREPDAEPEPVRAPGPLRWHGPALEPPLLPAGVQQVARAADGAIWLARCESGLTRIHPGTGERHTWTVRDGLPPGCITQVATTDTGQAWALTPDRAARVHPADGPVEIVVFDEEDRASVGALLVARDGTVWLGGQGGRLRGLRTDGTERRFSGARLGALDSIHALAEAPDGALWISTPGRLTRLDPSTGSFSVRVSHGARPELPPGRPGPVVNAEDGAWVVVRPERPGDPSTGLVHLTDDGFEPLSLPGMPELPLSMVRTEDDALWIADGRGLVRVAPDRSEARRVAVRRGFVPGGPWVLPSDDDSVWAAYEGSSSGATLVRLGPDGAQRQSLSPMTLPPPGVLVRADDSVLLATTDGLWRLRADQARWERHPGFGDGLRGWSARRLLAIHTGPSGRTWLAGEEGLRVGRPDTGFSDATPPGAKRVMDVHEGALGTTTLATDVGLFARDRLGRLLRVVDDGGRAVTGAEHVDVAGDGTLWAWGTGGAWTVTGSDAERRLGGPVQDLVVVGDQIWTVRSDVRVLRGDRFVRQDLPRGIVRPAQVAVRDGQPLWVRDQSGLWRRDGDTWRRAVGVEGPFQRSRDGTLWRWDPDGLHVLPPDAGTWRWVGLPTRQPALDAPETTPPIAADAIVVHALAGVLAVEVEGRVLGDPLRADGIVDLDVHGTRWAALSRRGVLLRGDGYRLLERSYVPGPARRVALGPRQVCVAGTAVWCRQDGRWQPVLELLDLPAPLPAVALQVDDQGRAWSLHPGALCRQGSGCRGLPGVTQTSLVLAEDVAWVGALQGLYQVQTSGPRSRIWSEAPVRDLALAADGGLWLATDGLGLVRWSPQGEARTVGLGHDPREPEPRVTDEVSVSRSGHVWVRQGDSRLVLPGPTRTLARWPWAPRFGRRGAPEPIR